jgi:hypothetical protein
VSDSKGVLAVNASKYPIQPRQAVSLADLQAASHYANKAADDMLAIDDVVLAVDPASPDGSFSSVISRDLIAHVQRKQAATSFPPGIFHSAPFADLLQDRPSRPVYSVWYRDLVTTKVDFGSDLF